MTKVTDNSVNMELKIIPQTAVGKLLRGYIYNIIRYLKILIELFVIGMVVLGNQIFVVFYGSVSLRQSKFLHLFQYTIS